MSYKIIKIVSSMYTVTNGDEVITCSAKKSLKNTVRLMVGDNVELKFDGKDYCINEYLTRKNHLRRPLVANIDQMIITISSVPKTDFTLVDKLLLACKEQKIQPIIAINKCDIFADNLLETYVKSQYKNSVNSIVSVSAKTKHNLSILKELLNGKITAFAGQSAVGKSSLLNAVKPTLNLPVGELSQKIERGKNTTRTTELYCIDEQTFCIDTPGFSMLTLNENTYKNMNEFFFSNADCECKFSNCDHINIDANQCEVLSKLQNGLIDKSTYNRYVQLFEELKEEKQKKYK